MMAVFHLVYMLFVVYLQSLWFIPIVTTETSEAHDLLLTSPSGVALDVLLYTCSSCTIQDKTLRLDMFKPDLIKS